MRDNRKCEVKADQFNFMKQKKQSKYIQLESPQKQGKHSKLGLTNKNKQAQKNDF